jgi:methyl-accepting chemotaxis protein
MGRLFSIRVKLLSVIVVVVVLLAVGVYAMVPTRVADSARTALRNRAKAEAALLAQFVRPYLEFTELYQSKDATAQLQHATADPLVAWAAIYNKDGERRGAGLNDEHEPMEEMPDDLSDGGVSEGWIEVAFAPMHTENDELLGHVGVALKTKDINQRVEQTRDEVLWGALIVLGIGLVLAWFLAQQIAKPLEQVTDAAVRIADGDISQDLDIKPTRDEVGELASAFDTMTTRLRDLARRIGNGAEALASAAAGMFSEVREQEALATQQTASLEEIRRTLETLTQAADQVTVDAETVRDMANRSLESSQQIAERTRLVSEHSDRIGEILSLIQNIADKSDLLALNASLEGTKAGEVGRGFSLVAAEMRRLSEHVMDSVRDIRKLIADTREASHASVLATEEGIKLSQQTANAATKISEAVARQREGTGQVKSSADEIVRVVNESLKGRAEATRSAEGLLQLSQDLKDAASTFRLSPDDQGQSQSPQPPVPSGQQQGAGSQTAGALGQSSSRSAPQYPTMPSGSMPSGASGTGYSGGMGGVGSSMPSGSTSTPSTSTPSTSTPSTSTPSTSTPSTSGSSGSTPSTSTSGTSTDEHSKG